MNIKFVLFPSVGNLTQMKMDVEPGMSIKELEDTLLVTDGFALNAVEMATATCLVDGLNVERNYVIREQDQEISFVNQALGGC